MLSCCDDDLGRGRRPCKRQVSPTGTCPCQPRWERRGRTAFRGSRQTLIAAKTHLRSTQSFRLEILRTRSSGGRGTCRGRRQRVLRGYASSTGSASAVAPTLRLRTSDGVPPAAPQNPHKSGSGGVPHNNPTDETTLSGIRRHGC